MTTATDVDVEKLFDDEFAKAAADAEKGVTAPAEPVKEPMVETKTAEEEAAAKKAEEDAAAKQAETDAAAAREAELAALTPEQRTAREAEEAEAARVKKEGEEAAARLQEKADKDAADKKAVADAEEKKKAEEETPEQKTAREEFEASIAPYEPTDEEKAALEQFKKDFPESAAAVEARLKSVDRQFKRHVYDAVKVVLDHMNGRLSPVEESAEQLSLKEHMATLHAAHEDYDVVIEKIPDWIKLQPALLQPTLQAAYDEGDTQSVLDLVAAYKASVKTAPAGKTAEQLAADQKALDDAAAKKKKAAEEAAALAPVGGKRANTNPAGTKDPNNYDDAFAEAAAAAEATK